MSMRYEVEVNEKKFEVTPLIRLRQNPDGSTVLEQALAPKDLTEGGNNELVWAGVPVVKAKIEPPKIIKPSGIISPI